MKLLRHILIILAVTILFYMLWGEFFGTSPEVSDLISNRSTEFVDAEPATVSFLGTPLYANEPTGESGKRMRAQLAEAMAQHEDDPDAVDGFVWHGRRLAYLTRYAEAIEVYSHGLDLYPNEPHLLRHRGHRNITLRRLDDAILDFSRAAAAIEGQSDEVEPDGQPNEAGIPTSTLQTNIWYHSGLALYLKGEFETAAEYFQNSFDLAKNDDMRVAAADWLYMSLRRAGRVDEADAAISFVMEDMDILENHGYHTRLLMYRGLISADSFEQQLAKDKTGQALAMLGYGLGNWYLMSGDTLAAFKVYQEVLDTESWAAFGFIAAEADLARLGVEQNQ
ncbi:MAG: hypothetical protein BMS9Abin05_1551 [Rhodothermia bacterium]|nr:MAG: hypothetical protein BMS9Abin05_1551 [Rhodothermia bacterium]